MKINWSEARLWMGRVALVAGAILLAAAVMVMIIAQMSRNYAQRAAAEDLEPKTTLTGDGGRLYTVIHEGHEWVVAKHGHGVALQHGPDCLKCGEGRK